MDEANKAESKGDVLKVHDDKKGKWNSFRKGKKHISKLWRSRKRSKAVEDDSEEDDDDVYDDDDRPPMSPDSAASSSIGRVPSITLRRPSISTPSSPDSTFLDAGATTDEDERYSSGRETPNNGQGLITTPNCPKEVIHYGIYLYLILSVACAVYRYSKISYKLVIIQIMDGTRGAHFWS